MSYGHQPIKKITIDMDDGRQYQVGRSDIWEVELEIDRENLVHLRLHLVSNNIDIGATDVGDQQVLPSGNRRITGKHG